MTEKIIYLVPEAGVKGFKQGYEDHSIDIPFRISQASRLAFNDFTVEVPLGCRTYAPPESGGMLLMPRSKCSLLWPKNELEKQPFNRRNPTDYRGIELPDLAPEIKVWENANIRLTNTVGYIDYSYRGEWLARMRVEGVVTIEPGKPLFQAVPLNTEYKFRVVESINDVPEKLRETERGEGGFGSTDSEPTADSESGPGAVV